MSETMRVYVSPLTGRAYATNHYRDEGGGRFVATGAKHDVTADVVENLMAAAWARGWNECNTAAEGDAPPNPYRPPPPTEAVVAVRDERGVRRVPGFSWVQIIVTREWRTGHWWAVRYIARTHAFGFVRILTLRPDAAKRAVRYRDAEEGPL